MEITCLVWYIKSVPVDLNYLPIRLIDEMQKNNVVSFNIYTAKGIKESIAHINIDENENNYFNQGKVTNKIFFKSEIDGVRVSVFVFKTGSIKISCKNVLNSTPKSTDILLHQMEIMNKSIISIIDGTLVTSSNISMINAQFKINKSYDDIKTSNFFRVVLPSQTRGRIGVVRFYVYKNRKFHIAVDKNKKCQVFAAKNIEELVVIKNMCN